MNIKAFTLLLLIGLCSVGCQSTLNTLKKPPSEKYVEVVSNEPHASAEESLKASGVNYVCKEIYVGKGSSQNRRACFVKAPPASMYETLGVKMSDLPSAILEDTGQNFLIVGQIALAFVGHGLYFPQ